MPNGTSGGVGGSEVQTRSLPDFELQNQQSLLPRRYGPLIHLHSASRHLRRAVPAVAWAGKLE